jgi:hypothetical protein
MNKKGQLLERPFIFIFILIVGALTFAFGFFLINNLIKTSNCAQIGLFVNDIRSNVERYYSFDVGSSTEVNLKLPKNIKNVCFYSRDEYINRDIFDEINQGLYDSINTLDYNLVFIPLNYCGKNLFKVERMKAKENPLCILNTGNIKLTLENKGDFVEISS